MCKLIIFLELQLVPRGHCLTTADLRCVQHKAALCRPIGPLPHNIENMDCQEKLVSDGERVIVSFDGGITISHLADNEISHMQLCVHPPRKAFIFFANKFV